MRWVSSGTISAWRTRRPRRLRKAAAAGPEVSKSVFTEAVSLTVNTAADGMGSVWGGCESRFSRMRTEFGFLRTGLR